MWVRAAAGDAVLARQMAGTGVWGPSGAGWGGATSRGRRPTESGAAGRGPHGGVRVAGLGLASLGSRSLPRRRGSGCEGQYPARDSRARSRRALLTLPVGASSCPLVRSVVRAVVLRTLKPAGRVLRLAGPSPLWHPGEPWTRGAFLGLPSSGVPGLLCSQPLCRLDQLPCCPCQGRLAEAESC